MRCSARVLEWNLATSRWVPSNVRAKHAVCLLARPKQFAGRARGAWSELLHAPCMHVVLIPWVRAWSTQGRTPRMSLIVEPNAIPEIPWGGMGKAKTARWAVKDEMQRQAHLHLHVRLAKTKLRAACLDTLCIH